MSEVTWYEVNGSISPCDECDADVVDIDDYYELAKHRDALAKHTASLAARVAELEAANKTLRDDLDSANASIRGLILEGIKVNTHRDRAERLAAAEAWYAEDESPPSDEHLTVVLRGDMAAFGADHSHYDRYLAAVRAVTRAATPDDAARGEDTR